LALAIIACLPAEESSNSSPATATSAQADEADVKQVSSKMLEKWNAADLDVLITFFANDYVQMPPGRPEIIGKKALRASWDQFLSENTHTLKTSVEDIKISGDLAIVRIKELNSTIPKDGSETITFNGKRLLIYRRGVDGAWKMILEIWNSNSLNDRLWPDQKK
jgi:uncharacterized protein (TIGR02246 family)